MNRSRNPMFLAVLVALFSPVTNATLHPATRLQASQSADQSDSVTKSTKKKSSGDASTNSASAKKSPPSQKSAISDQSANTPSKPVAPSTAQQAPLANSNAMVWVNTGSGVYHKPGSRYYGKTKQGKYMTEADAIKAGYHAAEKN